MDNPWIGLAFALVIGFLLILTAQFSASRILYLAALAIIGTVLPPLALGLGVIAVVTIVLTHPAVFTGSLPDAWTNTSSVLKGNHQ